MRALACFARHGAARTGSAGPSNSCPFRCSTFSCVSMIDGKQLVCFLMARPGRGGGGPQRRATVRWFSQCAPVPPPERAPPLCPVFVPRFRTLPQIRQQQENTKLIPPYLHVQRQRGSAPPHFPDAESNKEIQQSGGPTSITLQRPCVHEAHVWIHGFGRWQPCGGAG